MSSNPSSCWTAAGGTIRPVTYGALDPVSKQLQAFSVDVSDNPDPATLLNRMRGASVTVTYTDAAGPKTVTGTIVGVQTQTVALPNGGGTTQQSFLTLLSDGALQTIPLASVTDTQINDPELRRELGAALAVVAQSRDAGKRPVTLNFAGKGRRSVLGRLSDGSAAVAEFLPPGAGQVARAARLGDGAEHGSG